MVDTLEAWDFDAFLASMSPAHRRNLDRYRRVMSAQMHLVRLFRWPYWPVINVIWTFWTTIMDEGVRSVCKPRWGAMTFCYLNDGIKPTLYHTIRSVLDPNTPIYPSGAPHMRNR